MPHHDSIHALHKFFHEKEVNEIYISIFLVALAESTLGIFIPIFLYKTGFSLIQIISYYGLMSLYFVLLALPAAKITAKIGAKHSILLSTPLLIIYYIGLLAIGSASWIYFVLPVFGALRMMLYNYGYHINYLEHSDRNNRGKQLSYMGIITTVATIIAPFISGILITAFSFGVSFTISSFLLLLSAFPLLLSSDVYEKKRLHLPTLVKYTFNRKNVPNILSFVGYSIESRIGLMLWPIFLISVLQTAKTVGLLATLSLALTALTFYGMGRFVKRRGLDAMIRFSTFLYFFGWIGRIFADSSLKIFFIDSYKNLSERMLQIPWSAKSYDIAAGKNHFEFIVSREIILNLVRVILVPILILVFYINYHPFVISFLMASLATLLYPLLRKSK